MKISAFILAPVLLMAAPAFAHAEPPAEAAPPLAAELSAYAVAVEALSLSKAKGKWTEIAMSAGGYIFASQTNVVDTTGFIAMDVLGSTRIKKQVRVKSRFTKADGTAINSGLCIVNTKMWSGLWNTGDSGLYTCAFKDLAPESYALEAVIPDIAAESNAMFSMTEIDPEKYKVLKARMVYDGVLYEALPTGFKPENEYEHLRVATGYAISREGSLVGRIDFGQYTGGFMDMGAGLDRKSIITAPVAGSDGREAVIFFAGQLLQLPEANSPALEDF